MDLITTLARSILGNEFITPVEVMNSRPEVVYTHEQILHSRKTLPGEDVLCSLKKNDYGLMPQPPKAISLLDIRSAKSGRFYSKTGGWYENQAFAQNDLTGTGWLAVKKVPVNGSRKKNWKEQNTLLSRVEYVPNAAEASWFITVFFEVRSVRLFENVYVRTSSLDSDGNHVHVGLFDAYGLGVYSYLDSVGRPLLGLASARKF